MPIAGINLLAHEPAIRQMERCSGANGVTAEQIARWMAREIPGGGRCFAVDRQQQIELQKAVRRTCLVMVKDRIFPLVGEREIQQPVSIHVCRGNAACYLEIVES